MSAGGVVVIIVPPPPPPPGTENPPLGGRLSNQRKSITIELDMLDSQNPIEILHAAIAKLESEQK